MRGYVLEKQSSHMHDNVFLEGWGTFSFFSLPLPLSPSWYSGVCKRLRCFPSRVLQSYLLLFHRAADTAEDSVLIHSVVTLMIMDSTGVFRLSAGSCFPHFTPIFTHRHTYTYITTHHHTRTHIHNYTQPHTDTPIFTHIHIHTQPHAHPYSYTATHTTTHAHTHTRTHEHTHTRTQKLLQC